MHGKLHPVKLLYFCFHFHYTYIHMYNCVHVYITTMVYMKHHLLELNCELLQWATLS